jgi:hypothetical protein
LNEEAMKKLSPSFPLGALALAALAALPVGALAQSDPALAEQLKALREELRQVRQELDAVKKQQASAPATAPAAGGTGWAATPAPAGTVAAAPSPYEPQGRASSGTGLSFFGYGELSYVRPRHDPSAAVATAGRGVFGFGYRFSDRTRFAAELEVENAVASASDQGEVAFEQLYIEHDVTPSLSAKAGLFLMPVGILNETHEPTRYFGVQRNLVETAIIPTTWRELGVGLRGTLDNGLRWDTGLVTGFDLTKWDATSSEGTDSPLGSIHQEGQLAKARTLAGYGALNYNGIPGLNVGGSVYHGGAGQKQAGFAAPDATVTLTEAHARWQPGRWDLSALAAAGRFGGVSALNATFAGQPTPVPDSFRGWYAQAAYKVWQQGDYAVWPFARYERANTARGFSGLPAGTAPDPQADTRQMVVGASFYLHPQVVVKADYTRVFSNSAQDRLALGIGFHY